MRQAGKNKRVSTPRLPNLNSLRGKWKNPVRGRVRSLSEIGALWPLCKGCGHIAQEHDEDSCSGMGHQQCKHCGIWSETAKCSCTGYIGPTWEEFKKGLSKNEIVTYNWENK